MQISRHWRLNSQRYRLEGVRYENGEVRLQARVIPQIAPNGTKEGEPRPVVVPQTIEGGVAAGMIGLAAENPKPIHERVPVTSGR